MLQSDISLGARQFHINHGDIQESYDIRMSQNYLLIFSVVGVLTMLLATLIALAFSLRLSSKKILMQ